MRDARNRSGRKRRIRVPGRRRIAAVVGLLVIAQFAVRDSMAQVLARGAPQQAQRIAPWNGKIAGQAAEQLFGIAPSIDPASLQTTLARQALIEDATSTEALNVLGLQAQLRKEEDRARRIFAYSLQLTRRELPPRFWQIEEAVARGDIALALSNYEIVLRSSREGAEILYPILAGALDQPLVRRELLALMAAKPAWAADFVRYAAHNTNADPRSTLQFYREGHAILPIEREDQTALVNSLVANAHLDEAWDLYRTLHPLANRTASRDPRFGRSMTDGSVLDWKATDTGSIVPLDGGGIEFSVPPSVGGAILQQTQFLPPGFYALAVTSGPIKATVSDAPIVRVTCASGREIVRLPLEPAQTATRPVSRAFSVLAGCPQQTVEVVARATDRIEGARGTIASIAIVPGGSRPRGDSNR